MPRQKKQESPKMEEVKQDSEPLQIEFNDDSSSDESVIEKPKLTEKKVKKEKTPAQQAAWDLCLKKRLEKAEEQRKVREAAKEIMKAEVDKKKELKEQIKEKKQLKAQKSKEKFENLKLLTEEIPSEDEELIKPKLKRKSKTYVDSDGEEIETSHKQVVIINKIAPTVSHKKPQLIQPKNIPVFV